MAVIELPISSAGVAALLRQVPFGERMVRPAPSEGVSGYRLILSAPCWLGELLGSAKDLVAEAQLIEAHILVYLQFLDDEIDGQSQIGPGDASAVLRAAEERLGRLFAPTDAFWDEYRSLAAQQAASARWEAEGRDRTPPPFDEALFRALCAKGALLRLLSPAMARLAGRPERVAALDDLFTRFLGVVLLLDDLTDFEEDADRGQINALLSAAQATSRDPLHFHPRVARAAAEVGAKVRSELDYLGQAGSPVLSLACEGLAAQCNLQIESVAGRCRAATARHMLSLLRTG